MKFLRTVNIKAIFSNADDVIKLPKAEKGTWLICENVLNVFYNFEYISSENSCYRVGTRDIGLYYTAAYKYNNNLQMKPF